MASRTLPFPAIGGSSQRSSTPSGASSWTAAPPRCKSSAQPTIIPLPAAKSLTKALTRSSAISRTAGGSRRLYVVEGASGQLLDHTRIYSSLSPQAQARRVAAQVEWEVARQARRRIAAPRPPGTLLLLPARHAVHTSLRTRVLEALRHLFAHEAQSLLSGR